jgi:hypothetical protein
MDGQYRVEQIHIMDGDPLIPGLNPDILRLILCGTQSITFDQEPGQRTTHKTGQHQPKGCTGNPYLHGVRDTKVFSKPGRPGNGGAVTTNQGNRTTDKPYRLIQPKQTRHTNPRQVLQKHIGDGDHQQDDQRLSSGEQIPETGIDTDRREEINQQHITSTKIELNADISHKVYEGKEDREQQTTGDWLGNTELPQERNGFIQAFTYKEHNDAEGHSQKRLYLQNAIQ